MNKRFRWIAAALGVLILAVVLVWVVGGAHREKGEEAEEERVAAPAPKTVRDQRGEVVVEVSRNDQERAGLETETLKPTTHRAEPAAYGMVLDPAPLISLNGDLLTAAATVSASQAQFQRAQRLHSDQQNLSLKDMQAAEAKFRGDEAQFNLLKQRLADNWGEEIAAMPPQTRTALIAALVKRTTAIVHVSLPPGEAIDQAPSEARISILGYESRPLVTRAVSVASTVDPNLQGQAYLLRVEAQGFPLRPGAAVSAQLAAAGNAERGVVVPGEAVVRSGGKAWAYVQIGPERFARREVVLTQPADTGWFTSSGFSGNERVVVTGAQTLLSEELKSRIQMEK
jgi:hypothetical protein